MPAKYLLTGFLRGAHHQPAATRWAWVVRDGQDFVLFNDTARGIGGVVGPVHFPDKRADRARKTCEAAVIRGYLNGYDYTPDCEADNL